MKIGLVTIILVTHNSKNFLEKSLVSIKRQERFLPQIIIVDSGSDNKAYLQIASRFDGVEVFYLDNVGFARANNFGFSKISSNTDYVLFMNPDVVLRSDTIESSIKVLMERKEEVILGGKQLRYDFQSGEITNVFDSTGIFRKWFGRWYDRGQGEEDTKQYDVEQKVPALCGAFLFAKRETFNKLGEQVFDPSFFLYKEDIELGLRAAKRGITMLYNPSVVLYHGRGWQNDRKKISYTVRLTAAQSEILLYRIHSSPYILWALLKYILVRFFKV